MSLGAKVSAARGDIGRWWSADAAPAKTRSQRDWAADIARSFGHTRARLTIEQAPEDSPLSTLDTSRPFGDVVAEARQQVIAAQLARQRGQT